MNTRTMNGGHSDMKKHPKGQELTAVLTTHQSVAGIPSLYTLTGFWFIWFWVVFFIISCSICICIRRRRQAYAQPRYVIVDNQQTYGTVAPPGYQYNSGYNVTANVPTQNAVPASAPAYQEKPPDYETVAGQRK
ncbi:hypothetical protein MAR_029243 [Mya arenaria]|uniref:Uncharacterized protein n=1 Tax=Mya arenaria TaxID=6604 RepID=A0ABY7DKD7_MYAAR|nr:hypothetical protein MAR_029243 [Mya arenaria]